MHFQLIVFGIFFLSIIIETGCAQKWDISRNLNHLFRLDSRYSDNHHHWYQIKPFDLETLVDSFKNSPNRRIRPSNNKKKSRFIKLKPVISCPKGYGKASLYMFANVHTHLAVIRWLVRWLFPSFIFIYFFSLVHYPIVSSAGNELDTNNECFMLSISLERKTSNYWCVVGRMGRWVCGFSDSRALLKTVSISMS